MVNTEQAAEVAEVVQLERWRRFELPWQNAQFDFGLNTITSPVSIIEAINQLKKGAEVVMLSAELMRDRIASLEKANEAVSARKQGKKKRI
jgi:hypothetical protein